VTTQPRLALHAVWLLHASLGSESWRAGHSTRPGRAAMHADVSECPGSAAMHADQAARPASIAFDGLSTHLHPLAAVAGLFALSAYSRSLIDRAQQIAHPCMRCGSNRSRHRAQMKECRSHVHVDSHWSKASDEPHTRTCPQRDPTPTKETQSPHARIRNVLTKLCARVHIALIR
jgi:hypothetical protein